MIKTTEPIGKPFPCIHKSLAYRSYFINSNTGEELFKYKCRHCNKTIIKDINYKTVKGIK